MVGCLAGWLYSSVAFDDAILFLTYSPPSLLDFRIVFPNVGSLLKGGWLTHKVDKHTFTRLLTRQSEKEEVKIKKDYEKSSISNLNLSLMHQNIAKVLTHR